MVPLSGPQAIALRVLIVEDDPIQRAILSRCVQMLGWTADTSGGLREATGKLSSSGYDIVIIDLCLGDDDGLSLLHSFRGMRIDPSVIFVSGAISRIRAAAFRIAEDLGLRVAGTLSKPYAPEQLHGLLLSNPTSSRPQTRVCAVVPTTSQFEQALLDYEIQTVYQAKVDLMTGATIGVEALARWRSPTLGEVSPEQFVPVAEKTYLINKLTFKVLRDAIEACRKWREYQRDFHVAVNISPLVLSDPRLLTEIDALLAEHDVPPGAVVAEVTEGAIIANMSIAREVLTRLSIKGVRVSMDDFGTGYSSLSSLLRIPFTELKIDRSFIGICTSDQEARKIVEATVSLARTLEMKVVAEGIENQETGDLLRELGADIGQGWFFGRPMPARSILHRVADGNLAYSAGEWVLERP